MAKVKEMKSWRTIVRVFRGYIISLFMSMGFVEYAIYTGMKSCNPLIMTPCVVAASITGLYAIVAGIARIGDIDDNGWPEMESCNSCASLKSRLSSVIDDRNSLHKALAELKVE